MGVRPGQRLPSGIPRPPRFDYQQAPGPSLLGRRLREADSSPWAVLGALQALAAPRRSGSRVTYRVAFFAARKIAAALKRGEKAKAKVTVKLTDPAGNRETEKLRVRLK